MGPKTLECHEKRLKALLNLIGNEAAAIKSKGYYVQIEGHDALGAKSSIQIHEKNDLKISKTKIKRKENDNSNKASRV